MTSKVSICNKALQKVGDSTITALSDNSKQARACNRAYEPILREILRDHPWNFAVKRISLAKDVATPSYEYGSQFTLPTDCLRLLEVENNPERRLEGRKILTEGDELNIKYTRFEEDPNMYDASFVDAFATRLALEIVESLTSSNTKKQDLMTMYERAASRAKMIDSQEDPDYKIDEDDWLKVRI